MELIGYLGLDAQALSWVPQSKQTIRLGRCNVNLSFLILSAISSLSPAIDALLRSDPVYLLVIALITAGVLLNLYYVLRLRR
jgi:hypothetical protein